MLKSLTTYNRAAGYLNTIFDRMYGLYPADGAGGMSNSSYSITNANTEKQVNRGVL